MRRLTLMAVMTVLAGATLATAASAAEDVYVHGYTRSNGTYVAPYHRTAPNGTKADNYGCINHGRC